MCGATHLLALLRHVLDTHVDTIGPTSAVSRQFVATIVSCVADLVYQNRVHVSFQSIWIGVETFGTTAVVGSLLAPLYCCGAFSDWGSPLPIWRHEA